MIQATENAVARKGPGRKATAVALAGVYLFAFTGPWSTTLVELGVLLILVGSLPVMSSIWKDLRRESLFWVIVLLLGYLMAHTIVHLSLEPALDEMVNPNWSHWLRTAGLWSLLLGWWLYRRPDHIKPLVLTLIAGLILGALVNGDHTAILTGQIWTRTVWGYPPNYLGMASGIAALVLIAWVIHARHGLLKKWEWLGACSLLAIMVLMLYSSGSRSAWIAFPFGLVMILLYGFLAHPRGEFKKPFLITSLLTAIVLAAVFLVNPEYLFARMNADRDVLVMFLTLDWAGASEVHESLGFRLAIWLKGVEAFLENPLFGWGAGSGTLIVCSETLPYRHFHNIYLEVLVSFGLIGAALFAWGHYLIYARVIAALRANVISHALFITLAAVTVFFLIKMTNEIRIGQTEGRALITTLYAFYAFAMFRLGERQRDGND